MESTQVEADSVSGDPLSLEDEEQKAADALDKLAGARSKKESESSAIEFLDHASPNQLRDYMAKKYGNLPEDKEAEREADDSMADAKPVEKIDTAFTGGLLIEVNSSKAPFDAKRLATSGQYMTVSGDRGEMLGPWPVSTGGTFKDKDGKLKEFTTPVGSWSNPYSLVVPYSATFKNSVASNGLFFIGLKYAITSTHAIKRLGTACTHGGIRLAPENLVALYNLAQDYGMANVHIVVK